MLKNKEWNIIRNIGINFYNINLHIEHFADFLKDKLTIIPMKECSWCLNKGKLNKLEIFHPFDSNGSLIEICEECFDNIYESAEYCNNCERWIWNSNGYRINIRFDEEREEMVCVSCLQEEWLKNGMESFKEADFFNYSDLENSGYHKHNSYFCRSKESYKQVEQIFNSLKEDKGLKVINNIDSSGMGLEHHISLYVKLFPKIRW